MSRLTEAIVRLAGELERADPEFDLGVFTPASDADLAAVAEECAPLELPVELIEWWAWCGGAEVAMPAITNGRVVGGTWIVPARNAFDLFRSRDDGQWPVGQTAPHRYGPKNLLEIAGVDTLSVYAEIVAGSDVCPIWLSDVEESIAWPAFGSIAELVEAIAEGFSVTDPELVEIGWMWCMFIDVPGGSDTMPAIYVDLRDRNSYLHPSAQKENADPSARSIAVAWPNGWIERDR